MSKKTTTYNTQYARMDMLAAKTPGLFRTLKRGDRKKLKLDIVHEYTRRDKKGKKQAEYKLHFMGFEPLDGFDLAILQAISALGGLFGNEEEYSVKMSNTDNTENEKCPARTQKNEFEPVFKALAIKGQAASYDLIKIETTLYQILAEAGYGDGKNNYGNLRASLQRLGNVSMEIDVKIYDDNNRIGINQIMSANLLAYVIDQNTGRIRISLHPSATAAVLGLNQHRYTVVDMNEVRQIKSETTRILHQRLCVLLSPGEKRTLRLDTLRGYIYPKKNNEKITPAAQRKYNYRTRTAIKNIAGLPGWATAETSKKLFLIKRGKNTNTLC